MDGPDINSPFAQALISEGRNRGYSPFDISGSLGNAYAENGLQTSGMPGDNGTAFGGFQWRGDRFDKLKAKAASMGLQWNDPRVQAAHWYDEQDAAGTKGANNLFDANNSTIDSLRPGGWKSDSDTNENVSQYQKRLDASKAAYASLTGQPAPDDADLPSPGAQETSSDFVKPDQGVLGQSQQPQYEPTVGDKLKGLAAAFYRRDSPTQASGIENALAQKMRDQRTMLAAQQASEKWVSGKPYETNNGWKIPQTSPNGQTRTVPMSAEDAPKPDDAAEPTRQEVQAQTGQNTAYQQFHQIENVEQAVNKLRDGLAKGDIQLGPDMQVKMLAKNFTGNSDENARAMKSMESNMIAAATVVAQAQKGSMTNFKFMKDLEQVMPSFAKFDNKAAYDSLTRVTDGMHQTMLGLANTATNAGKSFPRLKTVMDPATADQIDAGQYFGGKIKELNAAEAERKTKADEFMKTPGRTAVSNAPAVGSIKGGYKFTGGDPANQSSWTKVD